MIANAISGFVRQAVTSINPVHPKDPALARMFGIGNNTSSGVAVDENKVMALPAVWRAVNVISNGVMKLPFYVFREEEDGREFDRSHASWTAVNRKANPELTIGPFRQTLTAWALLWGNGLAYINRPNWPDGPVELLPLLPDRTFPFRWKGNGADLDVEADGTLMYGTRIAGEPRKFLAEDVLHIRGLGPNPYWGYDVIELLKEAFGGVMAASEFGHRFYGQGANPAGFVEAPVGLKGDALERFIESMNKITAGLGKAHKIALLEEGAQFKPYTIDPDKAQFLEGKEFDVRQMSMVIGVKVHKLIDGANTSYNSLEQANQEHKDDDLIPWICRHREEMTDKLLTEQEKETGSHSIDVDDEAMQWVPFKDRAEGVVKLYNNGVIEKDEARRKVNFGPSQSSRAKDFRKPANIDFEDDIAVMEPVPLEEEPEEESQDDVTAAYLGKIQYRLCKEAEAKAKKGAKSFITWVDRLQTEAGPASIQHMINDVYTDCRTQFDRCTETATTDGELVLKVASAISTILGTES